MCHLYDIDSDLKPIKHTQFKHDSVQDAMLTAQSEFKRLFDQGALGSCFEYGADSTIEWSTVLNVTCGYVGSEFNKELFYQIVE